MRPNIVMVLLDGSRWDRLDKSKDFEFLAKRGTLLNNVTTAIPYTFGSMNVIFTGLYGKENGVNAYYKMFKLKDDVDFLPEILQKNGYHTCCDLITEKVISKRGFDVYQAHDENKDDLMEKHPQILKDAFEKADKKPVFCFFQYSRIHKVTVTEVVKKYEWNDTEFYDRKEKNMKLFDDVFLETSQYAKKMHQTIEELGKSQDTILIFFSDHGTGIGERFGERNYGVYTYEETIRTFYLFIGPNINKDKLVSSLQSTIDIYPTILELTEIKNSKPLLGKSLCPYLFDDDVDSLKREFTFSETGGLQGPFPSPNEPNVFCIKTDKYKLIFFQSSDEWKLFDLNADPLETKNLIGKNLSVEKELIKKLLGWIHRES